MTEIEIKKNIIKVINFYGELTVKKLIDELQIRGVKEAKTREAFTQIIDEGVLKVEWEQKVIAGDTKKMERYLEQ